MDGIMSYMEIGQRPATSRSERFSNATEKIANAWHSKSIAVIASQLRVIPIGKIGHFDGTGWDRASINVTVTNNDNCDSPLRGACGNRKQWDGQDNSLAWREFS